MKLLESHADYCGVVAWQECEISWRCHAKPIFLSRRREFDWPWSHEIFALFQQFYLLFLWRLIHVHNQLLQEVRRHYNIKRARGLCSLEFTAWHLRSALVLLADRYILRWSPVLATSPRARWCSRHCKSSEMWQHFWIWRSVTRYDCSSSF